MKRFVMLVGVTGSGKSTWRKKHLADLPCISPDDFIRGRWTPRKCAAAWSFARDLAIEMFKEGESFVVDAQFVDPDVRREWLALARGFGFMQEGVVFDTSLAQIFRNQKARGTRGGYGLIPRDVVLESFKRLKDQMASGEFCNRFSATAWITVPWRVRARSSGGKGG